MANMILINAAITASLFSFLYLFHRRRCCKHPLMRDYPILGMLPSVLFNMWRIHDFCTEILKKQGGSGEFKGPWFTKMHYLITCDSLNVQHMLCKSFDNYIKGPEFREIFKPFGDGVVTADSETWKKGGRSSRCLQSLHLQDVLGYDPYCLSIDFPEVAIEKAFNEAEESIFYRHTVPKCVWKLQKWLQIGQEKKMTEACKTLDRFIHARIASKRVELLSKCNENEMGEAHVDLLTALMGQEQAHDDRFLRDDEFNLFVAGRDTITSSLTWFFWLVTKHPLVEAKILEEIKDNFEANYEGVLGIEEVKKLVYLHGALCEALRLFPPVSIERKQAIKDDTLPSGHRVNGNTMILFSLYAMGRCEEIWGKDCLEFKPERWISERGEVVYAPAYKFIAFNAGPRICLGKDLAFVQMKMVAAAILGKYRFQVVEGHSPTPSHSIVLLMKNGLKARIMKRL
ncbi:hypothetical protein JHK87_051969 [Glycine soja]|nr:hypothetical protein JHK87_051969 [Glycine soja]